MSRPFRVGDIVQLNSGGPEMTVNDTHGVHPRTGATNGIGVIWFGDGAQMFRACEDAGVFKLVTPSSEDKPS